MCSLTISAEHNCLLLLLLCTAESRAKLFKTVAAGWVEVSGVLARHRLGEELLELLVKMRQQTFTMHEGIRQDVTVQSSYGELASTPIYRPASRARHAT